jgi:hypothetical protein
VLLGSADSDRGRPFVAVLGAREHYAVNPHQTKTKGANMPILLWLIGIPIPLIILFLLLH